MDNALLDMYMSRFCNRFDLYDKQYIFYDYEAQSEKCIYIPVRKPVTREAVQAHLDGSITIGWPTPTLDGFSKWLLFDSDIADGQLDKLQSFLEQHGWHVIREGKRPGRDGHLWLLFHTPVPASQLRILAQVMLSFAGVTIGEVFPKQDKAPKVGNPVRGPLGIHRKPGANNCRGWFDGVEQDITVQLTWLAQQPLNSAGTAMQLAHTHRPIPKPVIWRNYSNTNNSVDFVAWARANKFEQQGDWLIGPCPVCRLNGHDKPGNHLGINANSGAPHCWRECTCLEICGAIGKG